MKKRLEFSYVAKNKLHAIKEDLSEKYGDEFTRKVLTYIMKNLRQLENFPQAGVRIAELYEIDTDYYYLFLKHNYFIYRIEDDKIIVVQIFHEKQDFIQKLFGISGRTQESIDYWGE